MNPFFDAALPPDQPQTHVLVIGVSAYPHLSGGDLHASQPATKSFGLNQLTSPAVSATSLTDWLLTHHHNPAAPLGSIELLLSPTAYTPSDSAEARLGVAPGTSLAVEEARFNSIKAATSRWFLRTDTHEDNVALFYFCGHGLEASDQYLLPADFGADPLDWTANIINFTTTYRNLERGKAKTQCFFLDACRDRPSDLQAQAAMGPLGQPLIGPQSGVAHERDAPIYLAAAPRRSAAGLPGQKSFFTSALIQCLNGMGARQLGSVHAPIDHESLRPALRELVHRLAEDHGQRDLRCAVSGECVLPQPVALHLAPVPVQVLTTIFCQPLEAHKIARLSLKDSAGESVARPTADEKPWRLAVVAGKCTVEAKFADGEQFVDLEQEEIVRPPLFQPRLEIASHQVGTGVVS